MKFVCIVFCILLFSCSSEPPCYGPQGIFYASPMLSINNCININLFPVVKLEPSDIIRHCGWHTLSRHVNNVDNCIYTTIQTINTTEEYYHGFIIIDVVCASSRCKTVWELEFKGE